MDIDRYNLKPKVWGPSFWKMIHFITIGYPKNPSPKEKKCMLDFLYSLKCLIPCDKCREHYSENLEKNPPPIENREELINWGHELHNVVNQQLDKLSLTKDKFKSTYNLGENLSYKSSKSNGMTINLLIILLIIVVICFVIYIIMTQKKKKGFRK